MIRVELIMQQIDYFFQEATKNPPIILNKELFLSVDKFYKNRESDYSLLLDFKGEEFKNAHFNCIVKYFIDRSYNFRLLLNCYAEKRCCFFYDVNTFVFQENSVYRVLKFENLIESEKELNQYSLRARMMIKLMLAETRVLLQHFYILHNLYQPNARFSNEFIRYWKVKKKRHECFNPRCITKLKNGKN